MSRHRLASVFGDDGKLHAAPDLVVEVLSPGAANVQRDQELKLALYSRHGVREYWIVDWRNRELRVFRRDDAALKLAATLQGHDTVSSPLLSGFALPLQRLWDWPLKPRSE